MWDTERSVEKNMRIKKFYHPLTLKSSLILIALKPEKKRPESGPIIDKYYLRLFYMFFACYSDTRFFFIIYKYIVFRYISYFILS